MPVHDWTRVDAGAFHGFHTRWIVHLQEYLNDSVLPPGYFADGEQITRPAGTDQRMTGDVLVFRPPQRLFDPDPAADPGVAIADRPPRTQVRAEVRVIEPPQRHVVIRQARGRRVVALIEIVSPANKDRPTHVEEFAAKVAAALAAGVHVLVLDLFAPGRHDANTLHEAVIGQFGPAAYDLPAEGVRLFASYVGGPGTAYLEHPSVGDPLPLLPLFLTPERYVELPLEPSYQRAWKGTPPAYREVLGPLPGDRPHD